MRHTLRFRQPRVLFPGLPTTVRHDGASLCCRGASTLSAESERSRGRYPPEKGTLRWLPVIVCWKLSAKTVPVSVMPRPIAIFSLLPILLLLSSQNLPARVADAAAGQIVWFTLSFFSVGSGCHLARSEIVLKSASAAFRQRDWPKYRAPPGTKTARDLRGGTAMMRVKVFSNLSLDPKAVNPSSDTSCRMFCPRVSHYSANASVRIPRNSPAQSELSKN
jgi:hypothetical protein